MPPLSNPPYAYVDTDGKTLHGIAPDLSRSLEPLLGVKFRWVNTPFPGLMPGLQAHRFDMIWGSVTESTPRPARCTTRRSTAPASGRTIASSPRPSRTASSGG